MRKLAFTLTLFLICGVQIVFAQKVVTGKVTDANDGTSLPGVTVSIKGTTLGTTTGVNGEYSLRIPANSQTLVFSYVGYEKQELPIGSNAVINTSMIASSITLNEVVVTALGISREKKSLGYSVQDVKSEDINRTRNANMLNSLSGKVSGVQITTATGNMGGSSRVTIRGINSISGNNQPLYVVDGIVIDNSDFNTVDAARGAGGYDYGNMAQDINPDDIENVTVLKGPNAAAMYGSRASNGVIVISTKKGKYTEGAAKTLGVSVNSGISFDQVSILPNYQNLYGGGFVLGGADGFNQQVINGKTYNLMDYATDESWGPKYNKDVQYLPAWSIYDWEAKGKVGDLQTVPWTASENDVKSFFKTGITMSNSVDLTGGTSTTAFRLGYSNNNTSGYMPNMQLNKNTLSFSGSSKLGKKLNAFAAISYIKTDATGRPATGYDDNNIMQKFNQWGQRQLDMKKMETYRQPDGTQRVWNRGAWNDPAPAYSDNPYWTRYMNYQNDVRDRYFGNFGVTLDIFDWLKLTGKVNNDAYTMRSEERVAIGSQAQTEYYEQLRQVQETNSEFLFAADKNLSQTLHLNATFGGNMRNWKSWRNAGLTAGGMVIPDFFSLQNTISTASTIDFNWAKKINSLYGSASLGWKSMMFLDLTLRNDWSSTLPASNRSYMYPSITGSFILTELPVLSGNKILSFAKVRAGWAMVGNDTEPYNLANLYTINPVFNGNFRTTIPPTLNFPYLKPETTTSTEIGVDLRFLSNRIGLDFTYYDKSSTNQILAVAISGASGYNYKYINAGEITNKGYEFMLTMVPVKAKDFEWNINVNYSHNTNKVVSLAEGVSVYQLGSAPFKVTVNAEVGKPYGTIRGTNYVFDDKGNKLINSNGTYAVSLVEDIGNIMPKFNMGITNSFRIKGFELSTLIDIQQGGKLFSTTNMWGMYSGILSESVAINANGKNIRDDVAGTTGGGHLYEGVYGSKGADGVVVYKTAAGAVSATPVKNATYLDGESYGGQFYDGPIAQNIFKSDYIKLREVRLGYTIPSKLTLKYRIQNIRLAAYGRNLAIWGRDNQHIDPENTTSSGNVQGLEGGALPSLRTFGVNLSFNF